MIIKLKLEKSDNIGLLISNLSENVNKLLLSKKKETNRVDLSGINWICPLSILPIAVLLSDLQDKGYNFNIIPPINQNIRFYLKAINFFKGIGTFATLQSKSYIPIVFMSTRPEKIQNREQIENSLKNMLLTKMNSKSTLSNALGYSLSEMFDNIWEHARSKYGWFLAQYYKNKEYADICVIDNGISIKGSYAQKRNLKSDTSAIKLALSGVSTKRDDRGIGLPSTKNLIVNSSLRGKFILLSG